jgi:hypothetical protein
MNDKTTLSTNGYDELCARGVFSNIARKAVETLGEQVVLDTCRWFDDQDDAGPGALVNGLREGGVPGYRGKPDRSRRSRVIQERNAWMAYYPRTGSAA